MSNAVYIIAGLGLFFELVAYHVLAYALSTQVTTKRMAIFMLILFSGKVMILQYQIIRLDVLWISFSSLITLLVFLIFLSLSYKLHREKKTINKYTKHRLSFANLGVVGFDEGLVEYDDTYEEEWSNA